jgi:rare lipoprotein A
MRRQSSVAPLFVVVLLIALLGVACSRRSETKTAAQQDAPMTDSVDNQQAPNPSQSPKQKRHTIYASWYDVPVDSVAATRAAPGELTAAHDRYRIGTRLRVTNTANGRSVVVRITDRGVPRGKAPLDLCKGAAEELAIVREGTAKVDVEVLPDEEVAGAAPADSPTAAAQP